MVERNFEPNENFSDVIEKERMNSWKYGGRTVWGRSKPPGTDKNGQFRLF